MPSPITIDGVDIRSAAILNRDCATPITNLRRRCAKDMAFQHFPIWYGGWDSGVKMPAITGITYTVDTTTSKADACKAPIVRANLSGCELLLPNMKCIKLSTDVLQWHDLVNRYCSQRAISRHGVRIFDPAGRLDFNQPHTLNILKMAMAAVWDVMALTLVKGALCGDYAELNEFDGLYTQLANGWQQSTSDPCPNVLNKEQVIDWNALTGGSPGGAASPDKCTVAGKTITIWGETFEVPEGINLAEFLDDLWIEKITADGMCDGMIDMWEMHVYPGQMKCIQNTVTCMKPCTNCFDDPDARARLADFRANQIIELYPSKIQVPMVQSRCMPKNTIRFGPRMIDGDYTYGLVLDDLDSHLSMLPTNPWNRLETTRMDLQEESFLCADDWREDIEGRAMFWDLFPVSSTCVQGTMQMCAGVLATERHLWLRVDNVSCASLIGDCTEDDITVI